METKKLIPPHFLYQKGEGFPLFSKGVGGDFKNDISS